MRKLKERWNVQSNWQLFVILLVFAVTGSTAAKVAHPLMDMLGLQWSMGWYLYIPAYILIITPIYQIFLLTFGWLFGEIKFFWAFEKKDASAHGSGFFGSKMKLKRPIIAFLLTLALLTPSLMQAVHTLEGHSHSVCSDTSTHFHETEAECSIDLFHFSSFDFVTFSFETPKKVSFSEKTGKKYLFSYYKKIKQGYTLRGPPLMS